MQTNPTALPYFQHPISANPTNGMVGAALAALLIVTAKAAPTWANAFLGIINPFSGLSNLAYLSGFNLYLKVGDALN
jgi:hypothetical protein